MYPITRRQLEEPSEIPIQNLPILGVQQRVYARTLSGIVLFDGLVLTLVEDEEEIAHIQRKMEEQG